MSTTSPRLTADLPTVLAVGLVVLLMLALNVVPMANNDLWILMKVGELIVDTHHIPETLLFPFTAIRDNHFNAHEWLPSVVFHLFDRFWGLDSLMWIMGVFALAQSTLCLLLARRQSGSLGLGLLLATLAMANANYRFVMRPELFAFLYLVGLLLVLDRHRQTRRWTTLLWTIPIAILWANSHGSFLLGPGIAGIFALGEAWTAAAAARGPARERASAGLAAGLPYAVAMLAMIAACAINPAGWSLLAFPFQLQNSALVKLIVKEWQPTFSADFMTERAFKLFILLFVATLAVAVRLRRHLRATDVLLLLCFSVLALDRSRHIVWFGFVAMSVCARAFGHVRLERRTEIQVRSATAIVAFAGFCACMAFGNVVGSHIYRVASHNFSDGFVHELADPAVKGNVLNSYELGGELIYRAWPRLKPSIDSRIDSYGDDYMRFSLALFQDEALLDQFLDGNRVDYMLLLWRDLRESRVYDMPAIRAKWHVRLTNGDMTLLERRVPLAPSLSASAAAANSPKVTP